MRNAAGFRIFSNGSDDGPRFWLLQAIGWSLYAAIGFVQLLPRLGSPTPGVFSHAAFIGAAFVSSLVMRVSCRRLIRRKTPWPKAMILSTLLAGILAVPCAMVSEWTWCIATGTPFWRQMLFDGVDTTCYGAFVLICWSAVYLGVRHYQVFQAEHARALEAEAAYRKARLEILRYQLNPHFLFNTLNGISSLVVQGQNKQADRMLTRLAAFLRSTLDGLDQQEIPLFEEVSNLEQYLEIERARLGERLQLEFRIDPAAEKALVPALLLQPLAENAIRHGIAPRIGGGKVIIKAEREGNRLRLAVEDDGVGTRAGVAEFGNERRGLGLSNTVERLRVLYGAEQRLIVCWPPEGGCRVEMDLPWKEETLTLALRSGEHASAS